MDTPPASSSFSSAFTRRLLFLSAALVLLAVLLLLFLRFSWLYLGGRQEQVQELLGNYLPVSLLHIESLDSAWSGWSPELTLSGITLHSQDPGNPRAHIEKLQMRLFVLPLLFGDEPLISRVHAEGVQLDLPSPIISSLVSPQVAATSIPSPGGGAQLFLGLLQNINELHVQDTQVRWLSAPDDAFHVPDMEVLDLHYRRRFHRAYLRVHVQPPASHAQDLLLRLNWQGNPLQDGRPVQIYMSGRGVQPKSWLPKSGLPKSWLHEFPALFEQNDLRLDSAQLDLEGWGSWQAGKLQWARLRTLGELALETAGQTLHMQELAAWWSFDQSRAGHQYWGLKMDRLQTNTGAWPAFTLQAGRHRNEGHWHVHLDHFPLDHVPRLLPLLPSLPGQFPGKLHEWLQTYEFSGELRDLHAQLDLRVEPVPDMVLDLKLVDVELRGDQILQWSGLQGHLRLGPRGGTAELLSKQLIVDIPWLFAPLLDVDTLEGQLTWSLSGADRWRVFTQPLRVTVDQSQLEFYSDMQWQGGELPEWGFLLKVQDLPVRKVVQYFPVLLPDIMQRVTGEIFRAGNLPRGELLYHTYAGSSPEETRLQARMDLAGVEIGIWPYIQELEGELLFDGYSSQGSIESGLWLDSSIAGTQFQFSDLRKPRLQGTLHMGGELKQVCRLLGLYGIHKLREWDCAGKQQLVLQVAQSEDLSLLFPSGEMHIEEGSVHPASDWLLRDVEGSLLMQEDVLRARDLQGSFRGNPLLLDVDLPLDGSAPLQLALRGKADAPAIEAELRKHLPNNSSWTGALLEPLLGGISGQSDWQADVRYQLPWQGRTARWQIDLDSDLSGLKIELPAPLGKTSEQPLAMRLSLQSRDYQLHAFTLDYGGRLLARLPAPTAAAPQPAWQLSGELPSLSMAEWGALISSAEELDPETVEDSLRSAWKDLQLDLKIDHLELFGSDYRQLEIEMPSSVQDRRLKIHGEQVSGLISFPTQNDGEPWKFAIDRWQLPEEQKKDQASDQAKIDPRRVPEIELQIEQLYRGDTLLGKLHFEARRHPRGLEFPSLTLEGEGFHLNGGGHWLWQEDAAQTAVKLEVEVDTFHAMAGLLKQDANAIEDGGGRVRLNMHWPGSPADYGLDQIGGNLALELDRGLLDFKSEAAWLLSLFNLKRLLRFFSFDFSQLLSNKLSFDSIKGTFTLKEGNAHTEDLQVIGPTLDLHVQGRSGLLARDYDQSVIVVPHLSNNLSWAGLLFGPVGIGAGVAWNVLGGWSGIPQRVDQIFKHEYRITGSWDDPQIEAVGRGSEPEPDSSTGSGSILQEVLESQQR